MDGVAVSGICPTGMAYDKVYQFCLPEEMVDCNHVPNTSTTQSGSNEWDYLCDGVSANSLISHPNDCTKV